MWIFSSQGTAYRFEFMGEEAICKIERRGGLAGRRCVVFFSATDALLLIHAHENKYGERLYSTALADALDNNRVNDLGFLEAPARIYANMSIGIKSSDVIFSAHHFNGKILCHWKAPQYDASIIYDAAVFKRFIAAAVNKKITGDGTLMAAISAMNIDKFTHLVRQYDIAATIERLPQPIAEAIMDYLM